MTSAPQPLRGEQARPVTGPRPRVVVTGLGAVSAWGWGVEALWRGLLSGRTAIGPFARFDHSAYRTHVAGEVPPPPRPRPAAPGATWADRFAVDAVGEALAAAGLLPGAGERAELGDAGLFFGSSTGGMFEGEDFYLGLRGAPGAAPRLRRLAGQPVSAPAEAVARAFGLGGPVETVSSACASGTLALARALEALREGEVERAIAGGSDSLCRVTYGGFNALRSVDEVPCRPFRRDRAGLSIGEGGAALVLETAAAAAARGARPLAELTGAGASSDAGHMTAPDPEGDGAARALAAALTDGGARREDVLFLNAHGTGTPLNDVAEWQALRRVFGEGAGRLPVTAPKGAVGHLLGSAGALEAVATVLCLLHATVHPTAGDGPLDPEAPVDLVERARPLTPAAGSVAVSLNLAFGGCNAAVVFAPWPSL